MDNEDIIEALESTATSRKRPGPLASPMTDDVDTRQWRDSLLRFLEELSPDLTVSQIVSALEDYS